MGAIGTAHLQIRRTLWPRVSTAKAKSQRKAKTPESFSGVRTQVEEYSQHLPELPE